MVHVFDVRQLVSRYMKKGEMKLVMLYVYAGELLVRGTY